MPLILPNYHFFSWKCRTLYVSCKYVKLILKCQSFEQKCAKYWKYIGMYERRMKYGLWQRCSYYNKSSIFCIELINQKVIIQNWASSRFLLNAPSSHPSDLISRYLYDYYSSILIHFKWECLQMAYPKMLLK